MYFLRLNEGNVKNNTMNRIDCVIIGAIVKKLTYRDLTTGIVNESTNQNNE